MNIDKHLPLLSIIIPVYNVEAYLPACIESVLQQEYQHFELLLVNDGSTDGSLSVCEAYAERDKRIQVYSHPNRGQSGTQNRALDLCKGDLIAFLDSDDDILPDTYAAAIGQLVASPECDLVQFPSYCHHVSLGLLQNPVPEGSIIGPEAMLDTWLWEGTIGWTSWCKIYRRELFDGLRFKEGILLEDNLMTASILSKARGICFSPKGGYNFYVRTEQKTHWDERRRHDQMVSWTETVKVLSQYRPLYRAARAEFIQRVSNSLYIDRKKEDKVVQMAKACLREASLADIFGKNRLSPKAKLKIFALKLWSMLS